MAKRFTDTGKWDKASFQELTPKLKLVWIFLCDKCDHAGVWDINLNLLSFQIGLKVTLDEIIEGFGEKVELRGSNKLFVPDFVEFQYGTLNPDNRVHQSVMTRLGKLPQKKDLTSPLQGAKDKDKDKDKDLDKGECEGENKNFHFETLAEIYPSKVGKAEAFRRLSDQIKTQIDFVNIRTAIENYVRFLRLDKNKTWLQPKNFDSFVGAKSVKVKPWQEWVNPDPSVYEDQPNSRNSKVTRASYEDLEKLA